MKKSFLQNKRFFIRDTPSAMGRYRRMAVFICSVMILTLVGCHAMRTTGKVAKAIGKGGWQTAKIMGKTAVMTGKAAVKTGQITTHGLRTVVYMARGKQIIPLHKEGRSFYADVLLNKKVRARLLVDTGASSMQISRTLARKLRLDLSQGEHIMATLAGGAVVGGRSVLIREVRLGKVRVKNVRAIVLDYEQQQDDGLLGMSFLNHFVFQIDTKRSQLILQQRAKAY